LLVVIAVIGVLIALLLPAIQKAREASQRTQCQSNQRQMAIAFHAFHDARGRTPVYWGVDDPSQGTSTTASTLPHSPFGSWFVHLLPFLDDKALYDAITTNCSPDNTGSVTGGGTPATYGCNCGTFVAGTPCTPTYGAPATVTVPATTYNGHTTPGYSYTYLPVTSCTGGTPDSCTGGGPGCVPGYYGGSPGVNPDWTGIWWSKARIHRFGYAICPSDPSYLLKAGLVTAYGAADTGAYGITNPNGGLVWGSTNYLANWWVFNGNITQGYLCGSGNLFSMPDGSSNTILLGEGYANCDQIGRVAFLVDYSQMFGITWRGGYGGGGNPQEAVDPSNPSAHGWGNGLPNTYMFQFQPLLNDHPSCPNPAGDTCCNNWAAQTPHLVMNVAMGDGSIKAVGNSISSTTWSRAMKPNDLLPNGPDW
jgi:type II secretory pathway pseudopilin PulG